MATALGYTPVSPASAVFTAPPIAPVYTVGGLPSAAAGNLPVASAAARRVLCLPIHPDLGDADVERICALVAAPARVRAA